MHKMHRLITGTDYPLLRPLTKSELQTMDWRPSYPGCNHYYHQSTPLQIALQVNTNTVRELNCEQGEGNCLLFFCIVFFLLHS